ncbi:hypothetical protein VKT23_020381 [Stygiomarasmius scandens]|uniref:F-box domain-containing protein n=1 Tax=Marasmiellus scandens TaxID=2682957 RepID=A0ABR1IKX6_9AGAR
MCTTVDEQRLGVEAWLDRSGSLPLSFSIYGSCRISISRRCTDMEERAMEEERNAKIFSQHAEQLLRCFTRQSHRWYDVEVRLNQYCARMLEESMALVDPDWQVKSLNSFTFEHLDGESSNQEHLACLSKFLTAPRLRRVVIINDRDVLQYLEQPNPNLSQLDIFSSFRPLPLPHFFSLLSRYVNLHICRLSVCIPWEVVSLESYPAVSLPLLRKLSLNVNVGRENLDIDQLFNKISIPMLRSLTVTVHVDFRRATFARAPFRSWLIDNQIRELNLNLPLSPEAYLECLALVPNLSWLAIQDWIMNEESAKMLVNHLVPSSERPEPLCPMLQRLIISGLDVDDGLMLNLARSRRNSIFGGAISLGVLKVKFPRYKQRVDIDDMLDELRNQGMVISFGYYMSFKETASLGQRRSTVGGPFDRFY